MNWYIGQEIVAVDTNMKNTNEKPLVKNKVYTIKGLKQCNCKGSNIKIDVGISNHRGCRCYPCDTLMDNFIWYFSESRFVPLEYNQDAINELLEETLVEIKHK